MMGMQSGSNEAPTHQAHSAASAERMKAGCKLRGHLAEEGKMHALSHTAERSGACAGAREEREGR